MRLRPQRSRSIASWMDVQQSGRPALQRNKLKTKCGCFWTSQNLDHTDLETTQESKHTSLQGEEMYLRLESSQVRVWWRACGRSLSAEYLGLSSVGTSEVVFVGWQT